MRSRFELAIERSCDFPIMIEYSDDGTPINTSEQRQLKVDGHTVVRSGRQSREFLVQRAMLMTCPSGVENPEFHLLMRDPLRLRAKDAVSIWSCKEAFCVKPCGTLCMTTCACDVKQTPSPCRHLTSPRTYATCLREPRIIAKLFRQNFAKYLARGSRGLVRSDV